MNTPEQYLEHLMKGIAEVREKQVSLELRLKPDHAIEVLRLVEKLQNG